MSDALTKVLIVTDIPESQADTMQALQNAPDFEVVGVADGGAQAVTLAQVYMPDVVIMDYDMPGLDSAETTRAILRDNSNAQVIMLSVVNDPNDIRSAMRAGARDYLIKPLEQDELIKTIRWLLHERRDFARMQTYVKTMRKAYEALFTDDKPVPPTVINLLEAQVQKTPGDRLALETLAVAYARNREWAKLAPIAATLSVQL